MVEIELIKKETLWRTLGPIISIGILVAIVGLIGAFVIRVMPTIFLKNLISVVLVICLVLVVLYGTQIASYIL